jgi:hypothetical protein
VCLCRTISLVLPKNVKKKKNCAFHMERKESKPKAWVRMSKDIEMNPKAGDSHPSTNEA